MPTFIFNKLIRDKLKEEYERMGQKATYKKLSGTEYIVALKNKLIEEANEIDPTNNEITGEIADIQQVLDDLKKEIGVSDDTIASLQQKKFEKKGGFVGAHFVRTLELSDEDEWSDYYRKKPDVFIEIKPGHKDEQHLPPLELGVYENFRGDRYEVMGVALHTETMEALVVYRPLYFIAEKPDVQFWVRPYKMFIGKREVDGKMVPRFKKL